MIFLRIFCLVILVFTGCSLENDSSQHFSSSEKVIDKDKKLVEYVVFDLLKPKVESFRSQVEKLNSEITSACGEGGGRPVHGLKQIWTGAMMDFHYLEVLAFGPYDSEERALKDKIYSLPVEGQAQLIEREIKKASRRGDQYRQRRSASHLTGLTSLEYVLFEHFEGISGIDDETPACPYLVFVAKELKSQTGEFVDKWKTEEMDFIKTPEGQTRIREFFKKITDSLIGFVDKGVKDRKVKKPMGLGGDCSNCAELHLEHPFSGLAKEALVENLRAFSEVLSGQTFEGEAGFGYSSYLTHLGLSEDQLSIVGRSHRLSVQWNQLPGGRDYFNLFAEINGLGAVGGSLEGKRIYQLYLDLKYLTDWLKKDFVVYLNTGLPGSVQGDND